jgi:hypothetical protein
VKVTLVIPGADVHRAGESAAGIRARWWAIPEGCVMVRVAEHYFYVREEWIVREDEETNGI